ncbi:histidine kinase [Coralloluteibacterium stylophorae]|uniref:Signal transduction histidine kinase subgroup 3 dimerisation and phosphoacceptor domain-containing protein n=1 Tax=Coralloluteibacterium stylophorae TaxID=1776034 RepID=A0A8J7VQM5_9GAMM|nr:histidine kinase [Coralloluteibacterium stylophorae]MBS7458117.1 hypothetical protein [Coralloluteibacterium stylophorae]
MTAPARGIDEGGRPCGRRARAAVAGAHTAAPERWPLPVLALAAAGNWMPRASAAAGDAGARWLGLLALLALALPWLALALREHLRTRRRRHRHGQEAERERAARALHDALLQDIQGVLLGIQAAADRIPADDPLRRRLEQALDRAEEVLVASRDRARQLLRTQAAASGLVAGLVAVGEELAQDGAVRFRHAARGRARALEPAVRDACLRIGRDALIAAFQRSDGRTVRLRVEHAPEALRVRVRAGAVAADALAGLRADADRIGAEVAVEPQPDGGAEVVLRVAAARAYAPRRARWRWPWRRRGGEGP